MKQDEVSSIGCQISLILKLIQTGPASLLIKPISEVVKVMYNNKENL